jgi:peptidoglycan hydrolase-like protein with peptidoglycan-binding domain
MDVLESFIKAFTTKGTVDNENKEGQGLGLDGVKHVMKELEGRARSVNYLFGMTRERVAELKVALADATPEAALLGLKFEDAAQAFEAISVATRRNVIASTDDIKSLLSASQVMGRTVDSMVEDFQSIGVQFSRIGPELENAIGYVRNVGANLVQVMDTTFQYMSKMNQFNFQDGVEGLTRMATKATVLKFDMNQVFQLAENALKPEKAIELSSAFQRLGVSVGTLTDPFELMYKSLMDPEGLQDALVEMTAQYSEFNEQTKRFEITPYGKLMLREIADQAGMSSEELMKLSLNAADVQRKLEMIKPDFQFESEEDKMLLANLARMDKEGKYVIDMLQDDGSRKSVELQKLSNDQIETLIELQKGAPKTLEEIQRSQLDTQTLMNTNIASIKDRLTLGLASGKTVIELQETLRRLGYAVTKTAADQTGITTEGSREKSNALFRGVKESVESLIKGDDNAIKDLEKSLETLGEQVAKEAKERAGGIPTSATDFPKMLNMIKDEAAKINELMKNQPMISGAEMTDEMKKRNQEQRRAQRELKQAEQRISQIINNQSLTQYYSTGIQGRQFTQQGLMPNKIDVNVTGGQITKIELTGSPELVKMLSTMPEMDRKKFVAQFDEELFKIIKQGVNKVDGDYMPKR